MLEYYHSNVQEAQIIFTIGLSFFSKRGWADCGPKHGRLGTGDLSLGYRSSGFIFQFLLFNIRKQLVITPFTPFLQEEDVERKNLIVHTTDHPNCFLRKEQQASVLSQGFGNLWRVNCSHKKSEAKREHENNAGCRTEMRPKQMDPHGNKTVGMSAPCPQTALRRERQFTDSGSSVCNHLKYTAQCLETGQQQSSHQQSGLRWVGVTDSKPPQ